MEIETVYVEPWPVPTMLKLGSIGSIIILKFYFFLFLLIADYFYKCGKPPCFGTEAAYIPSPGLYSDISYCTSSSLSLSLFFLEQITIFFSFDPKKPLQLPMLVPAWCYAITQPAPNFFGQTFLK
jgi:hypothetical protein